MSDLLNSPWWVVAAGGLPSVASGAWVIWRWHLDRVDRRSDGQSTREERLARELEAQRAALSKEQADLFDRLRGELARCQGRLSELERDRDRGWDLARFWNRRAHELRHAGLNAQTIVAGLCAREELPVPVWPDMNLPNLEEPR